MPWIGPDNRSFLSRNCSLGALRGAFRVTAGRFLLATFFLAAGRFLLAALFLTAGRFLLAAFFLTAGRFLLAAFFLANFFADFFVVFFFETFFLARFFFNGFFLATLLLLTFLATAFLREAVTCFRFLLAAFFAAILNSCRTEKRAGLYIACGHMEAICQVFLLVEFLHTAA